MLYAMFTDLATHCRLLLHDRPKYRRLFRYAALYPLYVLCEIAIISTDLAELLGSAIGLCLIFPTLPLYAGVLLTASDVLVFLLLGDPSRGQGRPVKTFEYTIIALVSVHIVNMLTYDFYYNLASPRYLPLWHVLSYSSSELALFGPMFSWATYPRRPFSKQIQMPYMLVSLPIHILM